jgi:SAM-dependent methyltransferase
MAKEAERNYFAALDEASRRETEGKPFSIEGCGRLFMELGALFSLLPPPPARLLDLGCGLGWTSRFFARRGYAVTGVDIAPDMIQGAERLRLAEGITSNLRFEVMDYESCPFVETFDAAVFFDSLHHSEDEVLALKAVHRALAPGGICLTSEPGVGHADSQDSREARARFGVTERDMDPPRIWRAAQQAGFTSHTLYAHTYRLGHYYKLGPRFPGRKPFWMLLKALEGLVRPAAARRGDSYVDLLRLMKGMASSTADDAIVLLRK